MKKNLLLLLSCFISAVASAQTEPANYKLSVDKFTLFYNQGAADSVFNLFNATMKAALPLEKTKQITDQLKTQLGNIQTTTFKNINNGIATYKTAFTKGVLVLKIGVDAENKLNMLQLLPYQEENQVKVDADLTESPIHLTLPDAQIQGSLITPKNSMGKIPVVLIIAGSGATDRNGNGSGLTANSYLLLANALGKNGIATLRFDKRFSGQTSTIKQETDLRFDDYVNDAVGFIKQLKADQRFSKVIVLGHSEGSLVGMIAAEREKVNGFVSLAGAGDTANKIITNQLKVIYPEAEYKMALLKLDSLRNGFKVAGNAADPFFRPSVQSYLISWFKYNPQTEIKKLKIPVLIVQGTTDLQVSVADAQNLKKAKPDANLVLIDGMNHVLKDAPADREKNAATYNNPVLPLNSNLVNAVIGFIGKIK